MIDITGGGHDLSRRVRVRTMPLFSFREYITITKHITIPRYHVLDILTRHQAIAKEHLHRYTHTQFADYLKMGQFGYAFES
ncbi:MAG: hypothetical protein NZL83_04490 [Candidatus Absconditabacterales bacterium]|nr:hypothetical protein [Candidatus Absconditabacterales bacterium]